MKTLFFLLCPLFLSVSGGGQVASAPVTDLPTIQAIVLTLDEKTARVEAQSGTYVRAGEQFTFPVQELPGIGVRPGDVVLLNYTGFVLETWPGQIEVTDWRIVTPAASSLTGQTPPALSLQYDGQSLSLTGLADTWTYDEENGTQTTICSCWAFPLDVKDSLPTLPRTSADAVRITFPVYPDTVTIRCWPSSLAGQQEAYEQQAVTLNWDGNGFTLPGTTDGLVFEILATWNERSEHASFGSAAYVFSLSQSA